MSEIKTLELNKISKRYHTGPFVIENFNYSFKPRSTTGLIGPNGSGKTTLMRILSTAAYPTSGSVKYGSLNIHEYPHKYLSNVGVVSEASDLPQYLSAVELLEWICRSRNCWNSSTNEEIENLLDKLFLDERRKNLIGTYSSGMLKKTQIAAALISQPKILLLDEPLRGLDKQTSQATIGLLKQFKENGILILSSHMRDSLDSLCEDFISFPIQQSVNVE